MTECGAGFAEAGGSVLDQGLGYSELASVNTASWTEEQAQQNTSDLILGASSRFMVFTEPTGPETEQLQKGLEFS